MGEVADSNIVKARIDPYLVKTITLKSHDPESGSIANAVRPVIVGTTRGQRSARSQEQKAGRGDRQYP
jgi:hypothetical protein